MSAARNATLGGLMAARTVASRPAARKTPRASRAGRRHGLRKPRKGALIRLLLGYDMAFPCFRERQKLIPKNHGFGTRRLPLETRYYEVYNQPNVALVDINETPIERITPAGVKTSDAEYGFDVIIYATGFDAITGSFDRIDIRASMDAG
jgi:cation diffusion facilitator CzcD-associated flavoprotein CzcO